MSDSEIIRTRGLVLTDSQGRDRVKLWLDPDAAERPRLDFFDTAGRIRLELALSSREDPFVRFYGPDGGTFLYIGGSYHRAVEPNTWAGGMIGFDVDEDTTLPDRTVLVSDSRAALANAARASLDSPAPDDALAQAVLNARAQAARTAARRARQARRRGPRVQRVEAANGSA